MPHGEPLRFGFQIAGHQKAGTTSLSGLLDLHPQVQPAPRKEMHFFDDERRDWSRPDYADYRVTPDDPGRRIVGDATPLYLWWPRALERMHDYDPAMRLVVVFRDPIDRLFSQWQMVRNRWPQQAPTWDTFLTRFAPDGLDPCIPPGVHVGAYRMQSGIVRGYYGAQLERAHEIFGPERLLLLEFQSLVTDHEPAVDAVTDFLGLDRFAEHPPLPHELRGRPTTSETVPTADSVAGLVQRYRDDFETFKKLSGLEVGHWTLQRLLDGLVTPAEVAERYAAKVRRPGAGRPAPGAGGGRPAP